MRFCIVCENMYYIRINEDQPNKLDYYCRNCGHVDDQVITSENMCISKTQIKKDEQSFGHIINKYTKLDPTLPRTNKILCPNPLCDTNTKEKDKEIIYIRYDDSNMKYVYLCSTCDTIWKTNTNTNISI
jgi:DNA-directed RNA polymerase subunit M/transcription elongation factor TFIIS